ncbi:MAG: GTPase Era [Acidobacteria bacterium]|nr:GTPase Era [Acidobacteriota bacterium]
MSKPRTRKPAFRSGFVSLLGRPNSGKSTLLNALTGMKLAIVADKPQTTRTTIQGVWNTPQSQVVFVDTPGIHQADSLFNRRMMQSIGEALQERDLLLFLIDSTRPPSALDEQAVALIRQAGAPAFAVFNKIDALSRKDVLLALIEHYRQWHPFEEVFPISALTGEGVEELRAAILQRMPAGPAWFPPDHITDQPERFLASEIIREKILALTRQEVPHSVAVLIDEWKEDAKLTRISATIHVERTGQKIIVLGARGALLKEVGTQARVELESILGTRVFLTLFVKVSPNWRENEQFLKELDWRAMIGAAPAAPTAPEASPGAADEPDGPVIL